MTEERYPDQVLDFDPRTKGFGVRPGQGLVVPRGIDPETFAKASSQKAVMMAEITPGGSVLVKCPYCLLYWGKIEMVDVTKFVDRSGKRETKCECPKGHTLKFRAIDQWREERQEMGLQVKP